MRLRLIRLPVAVVLASLLATARAGAAEGWEDTRWGMSPTEVSRLHPALAPVAAEHRHLCVQGRAETFGRDGIVRFLDEDLYARFCFGGRGDRLRSVYLFLPPGTAANEAERVRALTTRHGQPLPRAADGTLPHLWTWRDGATLVEFDAASVAGWMIAYRSARPWPEGGLEPGSTAAAAAARPAAARPPTGSWRYVAPSEGGGAKFGWFEPSVPLEFVGLLLICREDGIPPGRVAVTTQLGGSGRPARIEARVGDGVRTVTVAGRADEGMDALALWAVLPGSHPLFGLLAETREERALTLSAPQLRQPQRYPLRGALAAYRDFARACGLQAPPGRD